MGFFNNSIAGNDHMTVSVIAAANACAAGVGGAERFGFFDGAAADDHITIGALASSNACTINTCGCDGAAGDFYITLATLASTAVATADASTAAMGLVTTGSRPGGSSNITTGNGHLTVLGITAADTCTVTTTGSVQTASGAVAVLNGQFAAGVGLVVLQSGMVSAALQLVVAIQLDIGIALAGHAHSGFAPAAGVDVQAVESDVHVALGGVDGDGVLIRRAGDDGAGVVRRWSHCSG